MNYKEQLSIEVLKVVTAAINAGLFHNLEDIITFANRLYKPA